MAKHQQRFSHFHYDSIPSGGNQTRWKMVSEHNMETLQIAASAVIIEVHKVSS